MLECCLPQDQMTEVLFSPKSNKDSIAIAAAFTESGPNQNYPDFKPVQYLVLILANGKRFLVPLSVFTGNPVAVPNFTSLELDDYGRTVRFGTYEACVEFALLNAV